MGKIQVIFGYTFLTSLLFWPTKLFMYLFPGSINSNILAFIISSIFILSLIKIFPHPTDHSNFASFEMVKRFRNF